MCHLAMIPALAQQIHHSIREFGYCIEMFANRIDNHPNNAPTGVVSCQTFRCSQLRFQRKRFVKTFSLFLLNEID